MAIHDEPEEWERARQLVPQWRTGRKTHVIAACGSNVRLLTKLLVLLDQQEREELIASWSVRRHH